MRPALASAAHPPSDQCGVEEDELRSLPPSIGLRLKTAACPLRPRGTSAPSDQHFPHFGCKASEPLCDSDLISCSAITEEVVRGDSSTCSKNHCFFVSCFFVKTTINRQGGKSGNNHSKRLFSAMFFS